MIKRELTPLELSLYDKLLELRSDMTTRQKMNVPWFTAHMGHIMQGIKQIEDVKYGTGRSQQ